MSDEFDAGQLADAMEIDSDVDDDMTDQDTDQDDLEEDKKDKKADQGADDVKSLRADFKKDIEDFKKTAEEEKNDLKKEISRLGFMGRENKKLQKELAEAGKKGKDDTFTDAQLLQMLKDHQDEPEVMFQIMKQMGKQAGDSATKNAESKVETSSKLKELTKMADKTLPGALQEGSHMYEEVQKTMEHLGLQDHPYGQVLSLAVTSLKNLPNFYKNVQEQTRKEMLGKTADDKRKDKIKADKLADKGSKIDTKDFTSDDKETVSKLGLTSKRQKELYAKFKNAGKKSGVAQTDE